MSWFNYPLPLWGFLGIRKMPAKFCDFQELYLYEFCQITYKLCNFTNFKVLLPLVLIDFS